MILYFTSFVLLNEKPQLVGPEGWKLIYVFLIILAGLALFMIPRRRSKIKSKIKQPLFKFKRIEFIIEKDKKYYPESLKLIIRNKGNMDVDIDSPLLVFDNFWYKKKFKLKGSDGYSYYPLFLEKGKAHIHNVHLPKFYTLYKKLSGYPKIKISIYELNGKLLISRSVYLRKTLIPF